MSQTHQEQLENGLWLVAEQTPGAQSLALTLLVPGGAACEPAGQQGVAPLLAEMMCRGAGDLDARQHSDALDTLGVRRATSVGTRHLRLSATMIGDKLDEALPLLMNMVRRPQLAQTSLEPSRDLCLQSIDALEDEPQQRVIEALRAEHFPPPLGRSTLGQRQDLEKLTLEQVKAFGESSFVPDGAVLGVTGRFEWDRLRAQVQRLLGDWQGKRVQPEAESEPERMYHHREADTSQVHIALAYDAVPEIDPDNMLQRAGAAVLSGGMSGRLFTEVREKRGLCYAVTASYSGQKERGTVLGYAGTTTPRAAETLEVMEAEHRKLAGGATKEEFDRAIVGMKSRLVMSGESTSARAAAIAGDQYMRGRPRSLDEVAAEVDAVTLEKLNTFLADHRPGPMTVVTIGPHALRN